MNEDKPPLPDEELDAALLTRRRGNDLLQLDDGFAQREVGGDRIGGGGDRDDFLE